MFGFLEGGDPLAYRVKVSTASIMVIIWNLQISNLLHVFRISATDFDIVHLRRKKYSEMRLDHAA